MLAYHYIFHSLCDRLTFREMLDVLSEGIALQETRVQHNDSMDLQLLACPICYEPLIRKGPAGLNV